MNGTNLSSENQDSQAANSGLLDHTKRAVRETARETFNTIKQKAGSAAAREKSVVADRISDYKTAVEKSADAWEGEDPNIAWLTRQLAQKLNQAADYVRSGDFERFRGDATNIAQRHPVLFFGGLFTAGVVIGNFLKATADATRDEPARISDQPSVYPGAEDVARLEDDENWPEVPPSETIK